VDLTEEIKEILPLIQASIPRQVELNAVLEPDLPRVEADRAQIQQLVTNLIMNGAEAIPDRPGTVTITTESQAPGGLKQVVLRVHDTGSGMDEETKTRIFDPFFTTKFTGRGLGLAAVLGIIRTHRGQIFVESTPGQGSTFTVVLPAAPADAVISPPQKETDAHGEGTILVVDDEELVRNMARATLERYGYSVEAATDGSMAVSRFAESPQQFSAVLLDLTMPVMNGEDALGKIKQIRPDVPVVLSSGYDELEAMSRFADRGLSGFLQKPYTATALATKIKTAVRGRAVREGAVVQDTH
jgi:CheY-like chemotaxis protein